MNMVNTDFLQFMLSSSKQRRDLNTIQTKPHNRRPKHTSQQEGGTIGSKLAPETGEEVDELESRQTLLAGQGWVYCS